MPSKPLSRKNLILLIVFNILTVVLFVLAWIQTMTSKRGALIAAGFRYLKYYTVISNALAAVVGIVFIITLILMIRGKATGIPGALFLFKYTAATMLSVTFLVVLFLLAPQMGIVFLFSGANLWYHLVIPFICMAEFMLLDRFGTLPFKATFITLIPTVIYAVVYLTNILINGRGVPPATNDWYGILNWGLGIGALLLLVILGINFGSACLLRFGRNARN